MDQNSGITVKCPDPDTSTESLGIGNNDSSMNSSVRPKLSWNILKTRRFIVTLLGMIGFSNVFALRASLSVVIVAMTANTRHVLENGTEVQIQEFTWNSEQQGIVLSSFYYGYIWTQIIGGVLAAKYGGNIVFGIGIGVSSSLMLLFPLAAKQGLYYLVAIRILIGLFEGVTYPSIQDVFANWAPSNEKTAISSIVHIGSQFGTFVSSLLSGFLADNFGWESIFYIFGGLGVVWYALWTYFIKRNPASDPRITVEEKNYIESNLDTTGSHKIPWISMITSKAMIAMIITNVSETMAAYIFLSLTPTYLNSVLKSDLGTTGLITAAPYLICMFFAVGAGVGSDYLRSRNFLTTQQVRKTMMGSGFLICAVLIVIMVNLDDPVGICACLILAISFIVVVEVTILCNPLDFAPAYCSVVMGICSPISDISGIVAPMMAGYILKTGSQDEWKIVFYIAVGFCILGTVVFTALGQGTIQPWAKIKSPQMTSEVSEITQI